ncbi:MAG: hypothetical protein K9G41_06080 [Flavobacteriales bacterium]|nr:hypothetical protein [Flavobacteriales bacterium]
MVEKRVEFMILLRTVQAFLVCLMVLGAITVYTDFDFFGIKIGFILTATIEEVRKGYPNWFSEIYRLAQIVKWSVPALFVVIFMLFRPWISYIAQEQNLLDSEFHKKSLLLAGSIIIALCLSEVLLRAAGWIPGQLTYSPWFKQVDKLYPLDGFTTDVDGIFKVDTSVSKKTVEHYLNCKKSHKTSDETINFIDWGIMPEVGVICLQNNWKHKTNSGSNEFKEMVNRIRNQGSKTCFDSLITIYQTNPFNDDGFYSIPFSSNCHGMKKVLLLGDSFTWGHSSIDKSGSFSNTLLSRGYLVYNTGISGVDVAQYKTILEKYLDVIQPDIVIANFFMGNDLEYFQRKPSKDFPIMYCTNAGNLMTFQNGMQVSGMANTYAAVVNGLVVPEVNNLNSLAAKTVIGTLVWRFLSHMSMVESHLPKTIERPNEPFCKIELEKMRLYCEQRQIPFLLSVIPQLVNGKLEGAQTINSLFSELSYVEPEMTIDMYNGIDGHFNEQGHQFYANYLEQIVKNKFALKELMENTSRSF